MEDRSTLNRLGLLFIPSLTTFLSSDIPSFISSLSHLNNDHRSILPFYLVISLILRSPQDPSTISPLISSLAGFIPSLNDYNSLSGPFKNRIEISLSSPVFIDWYSTLPISTFLNPLIMMSTISHSHSESVTQLIYHPSFLPLFFSHLSSSLSSFSIPKISSDPSIRAQFIQFCRLFKTLLLFTDDTKLSRSNWKLSFSYEETTIVLATLRYGRGRQ